MAWKKEKKNQIRFKISTNLEENTNAWLKKKKNFFVSSLNSLKSKTERKRDKDKLRRNQRESV